MIKIAFCAPFPVETLKPEVKLKNPKMKLHPASWIKVISETLAESGEVDLHLITTSHNLDGDQVIRRNGITYHLLEYSLPTWAIHTFGLSESSSLWIRPFRKIQRKIHLIDPDIVHGHGTEGYYSLIAVYSGYPNIISMQGIMAEIFKEEPSLRSRLVRHVEAHTVRKARFINVKNHIAESFVDSLSPNGETFFIEPAINDVFFSNPQPGLSRSIFFVGSLIKRKGIEEFVSCYIKLKKTFRALKGYVIGEGPYEIKQYYTTIARNAECSDDLIFTGQIEHQEMVEIFTQGGVFCLTSHVEASPNALMEAMAAGLPVVAMNVGDLQYRVENSVSGFIVSRNSVEDMINSVVRLLSDESLYLSFGKRGREIASARWKADIIARKHLDMYRRVLKKQSPRAAALIHE